MTSLPITRMTLDQHGVGFFERRVQMSGKEVELSSPVEAMNDVLKSLTVIDRGGGHVLGIDYATPKSRKEQLAACAIRLGHDRSLRDLLVGLRGRRRFLCRSSSPMHRDISSSSRPRTRRRRARHKRHRIDGTRHSDRFSPEQKSLNYI